MRLPPPPAAYVSRGHSQRGLEHRRARRRLLQEALASAGREKQPAGGRDRPLAPKCKACCHRHPAAGVLVCARGALHRPDLSVPCASISVLLPVRLEPFALPPARRNAPIALFAAIATMPCIARRDPRRVPAAPLSALLLRAASRSRGCDDCLFVDAPAPRLGWSSPSPPAGGLHRRRKAASGGARRIVAAFRAARPPHPSTARPASGSSVGPDVRRPPFERCARGFYADPPAPHQPSRRRAPASATPISLRARDLAGTNLSRQPHSSVVGAYRFAEQSHCRRQHRPHRLPPYGDTFPLAVDDGVHVVGVALRTHALPGSPPRRRRRGAPPRRLPDAEPAHHVVLRGLTLQHLPARVTQRPPTRGEAPEPVEPPELAPPAASRSNRPRTCG